MVSGGHTWVWEGWQIASRSTGGDDRDSRIRAHHPEATASQLRQMRSGWDRQRATLNHERGQK